MDKSPSNRSIPLPGILCLLAFSGVAFAFAAGCSKSEAATSRAGTAAESASVVAGAKAETDTYTVEMKAQGPVAAGAEATLEVTLAAKGDYHINKTYPYKFKAADPAPEGVTFPKPVLQRADGTFEEKKGSFKVPFVVAKAGRATVSG